MKNTCWGSDWDYGESIEQFTMLSLPIQEHARSSLHLCRSSFKSFGEVLVYSVSFFKWNSVSFFKQKNYYLNLGIKNLGIQNHPPMLTYQKESYNRGKQINSIQKNIVKILLHLVFQNEIMLNIFP